MIASGASRANVRRPTPKYHRLEADLRRRISAGEFAVGSMLPPEHDLSRVLRAEADQPAVLLEP